METNLKIVLELLGLKPAEFKNKVIVITGAGGGIGLQMARGFAMLGGKVVIAEINETDQAVESAIRSESGQAHYVQTDVSDPASVAHLANETHHNFGPVDILINNAIRCPVARVMEMDLNTWDQVMAVNLRGAFLTCKAFLPDMLARRSGTIINMISADAMPGLSAYFASKQGIVGFSQSLDLEVESTNIRVIPFGPGMVDTPGIRQAAPSLAPLLGLTEAQFLTTPLHAAYEGLMPPEHAAAAAIYLAARLADEFHGQVITGYEVLERVGFLKTFLPDPVPAAIVSKEMVDGVSIVEKLGTILRETELEFNKLPAFIRPMARAGFKSKSGQSLVDWQRTVQELAAAMKEGKCQARPDLAVKLEKLSLYYRVVPRETARFTKDASFLDQVNLISQDRMAVIKSLIRSLG
jgi:NAD(P)-dependent dehydrogenase (short-subunit alcohol dehydrogenase family)